MIICETEMSKVMITNDINVFLDTLEHCMLCCLHLHYLGAGW